MSHVLNSLTADVSRYVWHSTSPETVDIWQFPEWTFFALVQTNERMFISAVHCECLFTSSFLFFHGYIAIAAFFSTVIFPTSINLPLQVVHDEARSQQLLQTLCSFSHIFCSCPLPQADPTRHYLQEDPVKLAVGYFLCCVTNLRC